MVYIYIIGDCGLYFGRGSYSAVCVPPPLCIFHSSGNVYPFGIYLLSALFMLCMSISLSTYTPSFTFSQLCDIYQ